MIRKMNSIHDLQDISSVKQLARKEKGGENAHRHQIPKAGVGTLQLSHQRIHERRAIGYSVPSGDALAHSVSSPLLTVPSRYYAPPFYVALNGVEVVSHGGKR